IFKELNKPIITLIDEGTFSSGVFALIELVKIGSKTMGTPTGGPLGEKFGNIKRVKLPNSKQQFIISTRQYKVTRTEIKQVNIFLEEPIFPMKSYEPDYFIENKIANLKKDVDKVLEEAIS
ncbi:MAG: hypothetical protein LRY26_00880, partial [Bacilli bacterium]|nr:hypothetical protein [Bacilli bacterium]